MKTKSPVTAGRSATGFGSLNPEKPVKNRRSAFLSIPSACRTPGLGLFCALCLLAGGCTASAETSNPPATNASAEDLGSDFHDGNTNKIARVHSVTPTHVYVIYEGGKGGRNIPRQSLPPGLQAKYPYDAAQAAEYLRRQAEAAAAQAAAAQAAARVAAQHRENELQGEIAKLEAQDRGLQGQIELYDRMKPGNGRKKHLADLHNERQWLRERILKLQEQLRTLQERRDSGR